MCMKGKPFIIRMNDGSEKKMFVENVLFDYVPKVIVEGKEILLARKLLWYEYLLGGIPLILVVIGGMLGAIIGIIGSFLNFYTDIIPEKSDLNKMIDFLIK